MERMDDTATDKPANPSIPDLETKHAARMSARSDYVNKICESYFGLSPKHHAEHTKHPVLGTLLVKALEEAFDHGSAMVARELLFPILSGMRSPAAPESKTVAE